MIKNKIKPVFEYPMNLMNEKQEAYFNWCAINELKPKIFYKNKFLVLHEYLFTTLSDRYEIVASLALRDFVMAVCPPDLRLIDVYAHSLKTISARQDSDHVGIKDFKKYFKGAIPTGDILREVYKSSLINGVSQFDKGVI